MPSCDDALKFYETVASGAASGDALAHVRTLLDAAEKDAHDAARRASEALENDARWTSEFSKVRADDNAAKAATMDASDQWGEARRSLNSATEAARCARGRAARTAAKDALKSAKEVMADAERRLTEARLRRERAGRYCASNRYVQCLDRAHSAQRDASVAAANLETATLTWLRLQADFAILEKVFGPSSE